MVDNTWFMSQNCIMDKADFALLNYLIHTETVSVMFFPHGKLYVIPANSVFDDPSNDSDYFAFIHCLYSLQVGIPFVTYDFSYGTAADTATTMESVSIRLDTKRHNAHQRMVLATIENCAKKVIAQEKAHQKHAINAAITSFANTKGYN